MPDTRILSWNVNGLRAVTAKGGLRSLARRSPDIVCLQEVRCSPDQAGAVLPALPHRRFAVAKKAGYSGTAIFSRHEPLAWEEGIGRASSDGEGRVIAAEFPTLYVISVYVPNSQRGLARLPFRLRWDRQFREYLARLAATKPVLFSGDLNVAHQDIDIARPRENRMNAGFTDGERRSFSRLLEAGYVDTFRALHPEARDRYSWWSLASGARARNIGWRIDYVVVSRALEPRVKDAVILDGVMGSDHCPVGVVLAGAP
jgi:exodeoxyribonuclease III